MWNLTIYQPEFPEVPMARQFKILFIVAKGDALLSRSVIVPYCKKWRKIKEINGNAFSMVTGSEPVRPIRRKKII
ncbi:MAG: hypothetical protein Q8N69_02200 [bacterium]|nr:hypothetical protein [bacterium]